jgi:hypothetical protein
MQFRYPLPAHLTDQAVALTEFANGGAQCHVRLSDGLVHSGLLISNATAIIAMRGHSDLPFSVDSVVSLFQTDEDRNPVDRGNWEFFDAWAS